MALLEEQPRPLTAQQNRVAELIALGLQSKEIARILEISIKTVDSHRMAIKERLQIRNLAGIVRYAIRAGLIEP